MTKKLKLGGSGHDLLAPILFKNFQLQLNIDISGFGLILEEGMKHTEKKPHSHSLLWWLIIIVSVIYGLVLILVSLGFFDIYSQAFNHFSAEFFILTLVITVVMSYRRAKRSHGRHHMGPFLCSLLFAVLSQFILFLLSPVLNWSESIAGHDILLRSLVYIAPSLLAYSIVHYFVENHEIVENNDWFNVSYYISWVEMMSNTMTVVIFIELFTASDTYQNLLGIRGTIWAFYAVIAGLLSDKIEDNEKKAAEREEYKDFS